MPPRERLNRPSQEPITRECLCDIAARWLVDPDVMLKVLTAAAEFSRIAGRDVYIISGFRTEQEQARLRKAGRPTASDELSTHRSCLATGVDVDLGFLISNGLKVLWGTNVVFAGLRWGGGSPIDVETGIPSDWNHVDAGPRRAARTDQSG